MPLYEVHLQVLCKKYFYNKIKFSSQAAILARLNAYCTHLIMTSHIAISLAHTRTVMTWRAFDFKAFFLVDEHLLKKCPFSYIGHS